METFEAEVSSPRCLDLWVIASHRSSHIRQRKPVSVGSHSFCQCLIFRCPQLAATCGKLNSAASPRSAFSLPQQSVTASAPLQALNHFFPQLCAGSWQKSPQPPVEITPFPDENRGFDGLILILTTPPLAANWQVYNGSYQVIQVRKSQENWCCSSGCCIFSGRKAQVTSSASAACRFPLLQWWRQWWRCANPEQGGTVVWSSCSCTVYKGKKSLGWMMKSHQIHKHMDTHEFYLCLR